MIKFPKDSCFKIHICNFHKLLIDIIKSKLNLNPEIMNEVSEITECSYYLRNELRLKSLKTSTLKDDFQTPDFVDWKIWTYVPNKQKGWNSLNKFKSKQKISKSKNCTFKLCKIHFQRIDHLLVAKVLIFVGLLL